MAAVLRFQGGACSGNTMSFLNAEEPSAVDLVTDFGIDLAWHPSLGLELGDNARRIFTDMASGARPLDIFVFEGTVIQGPNGSGRFNMFAGRPMKDWVQELSAVAGAVVAIGDCACWGGIPATAPNPVDNVGLQFLKRKPGGFLGSDYRSKWGLPVINIPGCPAHPDWVTQILVAIASGRAKDIALDDLQRPATFFQDSRRPAARAFSSSNTSGDDGVRAGTRTGCLFYEFGCRGPMTHLPCNRILWNRQSSKTRAAPCRRLVSRSFHSTNSARHRLQDTEGERHHPEGPAGRHGPRHLHGPCRRRQDRHAQVGEGRHVRGLGSPPQEFTMSTTVANRPSGKDMYISPLGRVEGDLDLRITVDDGVVVDVDRSQHVPRLRDHPGRAKDPQAGLIVTPRICGICGGSHSTRPSTRSTRRGARTCRAMRRWWNIARACETLQSIPRWFYALSPST